MLTNSMFNRNSSAQIGNQLTSVQKEGQTLTDKRPVTAIYCRLSKEDIDKIDGGDDSESIQNQKLLLMDYATKENWGTYRVYSDDDCKGFDRDRPEFKRLLKDAENGLFDIVLCKHQSRFSRDIEIIEKYLHGKFLEWGIRFVSIVDHVDTSIRGTKKSRQINSLVNEWYSEELSDNIRTVFKHKMEEGQFLGSFASYGYIKDPQDRHKLIIDPEAAEVVKRIFNMYLDGSGTSKIAKTLTADKVLTPTQYKKEQGLKFMNPNSAGYSEDYGLWASNSVNRILSNPVYVGTLVQGRERKVSYKNKKVVTVPEGEWIVIPNCHAPIIDEIRFNTVQSLITSRRADRNIQKGLPQSQPHMLAGKLKCLDCGSTLKRSGLSRDRTQHYLICTLSAKSRKAECSPHCIYQEVVEEHILQNIRELIRATLDESAENDVIATVYDKINDTKDLKAIKQKLFGEVEAGLRNLERTLTEAYMDWKTGKISEQKYFVLERVFDEDQQKLQAKKEALEIELAKYEQNLQSHEHIKELISKYKSIDTLTHEIVNDFVESVMVGEKDSETNEQRIVINWQF